MGYHYNFYGYPFFAQGNFPLYSRWSPCNYCHPCRRMYCQTLRTKGMDLLEIPSYSYPFRQPEQREFTIEELQQYDGSGGNPAYVAVKGIVYDVSREATWGGGTHFGLYAGKDLTSQFQGCHGMEAILNKLPKVGTLKV